MKSRNIFILIFGIILLLGATSIAVGRDRREKKNKQQSNKAKATELKAQAKKSATAKRNDADTSSAKRGRREQAKTTDKTSEKTSNDRSARNVSEIRKDKSAASKRERAAQLRREEAKRRAEAERLAAIQRERQLVEALRDRVQNLIAKDDLSGEDLEVRRAAINALGNRAGTVVVMNPQTGRVYSIVNQEWAVREGFKPCSTIKLVTALAGLNENVIDPEDTTKITETNQVSLTKALAYSRNGYFQEVGAQVGFEKMVAYARRLGLGEKTGINARNEFQGRVPTFAARDNIHRISSHGDNFEVTPLQLATLVSAMANGGKLVTPYIVHNGADERRFRTKVRRNVNLTQDAWQKVIPGMVGAVNYGSGRRAHDPAQTVAGKTGTCIEDGRWVGLFTSYAPLVNPKLAVVVIARGVDGRSHFPAAVAGQIYRELNGRFGGPAMTQVAATRKSIEPTVELESDDEEESAYDVPASPVKRAGSVNTGGVKRVLMQIPNRVEGPGVAREPIVNPVPNSANGQTRPRRVMTR